MAMSVGCYGEWQLLVAVEMSLPHMAAGLFIQVWLAGAIVFFIVKAWKKLLPRVGTTRPTLA
eukprot:7182945-Prorocentrum_lima.AAC.1